MSGGKLTFLHEPNETQAQPRLWQVQVRSRFDQRADTDAGGRRRFNAIRMCSADSHVCGSRPGAADLPKHSLGKLLAAMPRFARWGD